MSKKIVLALTFGILMAAAHFVLGHWIRIDSSPKELRDLCRLAQRKGNCAEVCDQMRTLDLVAVFRRHMERHYGQGHLSAVVERLKEGEQVSAREADPDGILEIYESLYLVAGVPVPKSGKRKDGEVPASFWEKFLQTAEPRAEQTARPGMSGTTAADGAVHGFVEHMEIRPFMSIVPAANRTGGHTAFAFCLGFLSFWAYASARRIYTKILLGMIAGAFFGYLFGPISAEAIAPVGRIFIRLIKMIVVPLVFTSLTIGVLGLGDVHKLGRLGGKTIAYYMLTTMAAISIGLVLANLVQPGTYIAEKDRERYKEEFQQSVRAKTQAERQSIEQVVEEIVPTNPVESLTRGNMLQIIFFALLFGMALATIAADKRAIVSKGLDGVNDAMVQLVVWIMEVAPFGVFALMADTIAKAGISILLSLAVYALVVFAGLVLHVAIVHVSVVRFFVRSSVRDFFRGIYPAQLIAFSTSSSTATLPFSMRCAEENLGVSKETSSFVLPLGATINMDGTALYQGVAAVFIAQVYSIPLDFGQQVMILLTATLASIGAAGVPGAGIVILAMVLESIGVPVVGIALILGVDRILDMCRTVVNITGDLVVTLLIQKGEERRAASGAGTAKE